MATQSAEYPTVERRTVFVALKRPARPGGEARLTGLYALERTPSVIIGRPPLNAPRESALEAEETRNLELPFGESPPFTARRRSTGLSGCRIATKGKMAERDARDKHRERREDEKRIVEYRRDDTAPESDLGGSNTNGQSSRHCRRQ